VLEAPGLGERWAAAKGLGAVHQGRRIRTRAPRPLGECVLYCTTPETMGGDPAFARLRQQVRWTTYGGDCCAYGFVALGGVDLIVDRGLKVWDWCALAPIVQEAGGVLCDWQLRPLTAKSDGAVVCASSREVAAAALEALGAAT
jgi:fructose-1,6-bisphosphatase/inositol monophosphatase family enzyme